MNHKAQTIYSLKVWFSPVLLTSFLIFTMALFHRVLDENILVLIFHPILLTLLGWFFFRMTVYAVCQFHIKSYWKKAILNFMIIIFYFGSVLVSSLLLPSVGAITMGSVVSITQIPFLILLFTISVWVFKIPESNQPFTEIDHLIE